MTAQHSARSAQDDAFRTGVTSLQLINGLCRRNYTTGNVLRTNRPGAAAMFRLPFMKTRENRTVFPQGEKSVSGRPGDAFPGRLSGCFPDRFVIGFRRPEKNRRRYAA